MTKRKSIAAELAATQEQAAIEASPLVADLRATISTLERRLRKAMSGDSALRLALGDLYAGFKHVTVPPKPRARKRKGNEEIAVLHISDTQIGKITVSYDSQVAAERIMRLADKTCRITEIRRNAASIKECHVYLGGDMVEGELIFAHQAHEIDSPLIDQACLHGPAMVTRAILRLLQEFDKVKIYCVPGNHGRDGPRGTRAHPKTNWDRVFYEVVRLQLLGPDENPNTEMRKRVEYTASADETFWVVDRVYDWGNLLVHGDQITGGFAGFPWYGTAKKAWGWIDGIPEPWDNLFFGHFHTPAMATIGHRRFYANGTTESDNEFALAQLAACGSPCQRLVFFDKNWGIVSDNLIELETRTPALRRNNG